MPLLTTRAGASAGAYGFGAAAGGGGAMTAIASQTLTSDTNIVTFSSIPQTYDDLRVVVYDYGDPTYGGYADIRFNGDSANNYSWMRWLAENTSFGNYGVVAQNTTSSIGFWLRSGRPTTAYIEVYDYKNTAKFKTVFYKSAGDSESSNGNASSVVGNWKSTSAITSLTFNVSTLRNFDAGSVFALYGIKRAA